MMPSPNGSSERTLAAMADSRVKVAVRIRPLLPREALRDPLDCVQTPPSQRGQVIVGNQRVFAFDFAFGPLTQQEEVYRSCVQPLVMSLLEGYNATVFAYGQTGSGKTYTISGRPAVSALEDQSGIIPRAIEEIFQRLEQMPDTTFTVRASYVEVYKEELRDLLELETSSKLLHIREDERGNTVLVGAREQEVESVEELLTVLEAGNAARRTGSNQTNEHSSRSHALLTIAVTQRRPDSALSAKFHLVDLAGSERLTPSASSRHFQESVQINSGLLALGNVIRALSNPRGRRLHVPYRDAKITRLLRDSLGGNARTLMITCVSPASPCLQESLSSLLFASRARNVHNQPRLNLTEQTGAELEAELKALREVLQEQGGSKSQQARLQALQAELTQQRRQNLQYRALSQEAANLLLEGRGSTPSPAHSLRVQEWLEAHEVLESPAHNGNGRTADGEFQYTNILQLRRELNRCQEALAADEQLFSEREQQVKELQLQVSSLQEHCDALLGSLREERARSRLQSEQLVEQQLVIERLRGTLSSSTAPSARRPYSVPLITHLSGEAQNQGSPAARRIHTSPPAYSLERVMACFRMRTQLLKAQVEEADQVLLLGREEEEKQLQGHEEEEQAQTKGFRRSLNLTWTRRLCEQPSLHPAPVGRSATPHPKQKLQPTLSAGGSGCVEAKSVEVFPLRVNQEKSLQNQEGRVQGDVQPRKSDAELSSIEAQLEEQRRWLEQEEERVLQQRRGLEELKEELQRREELVAQREALSQERSQIHLKKLRSSQVLERDLLTLSARLSAVDEELQQGGGAALERLREEREQLCRRRDVLDHRLRDGSVLTPEEEHMLFQVEEGIEVLDAVVEYKNLSIHSRERDSAAPTTDTDMMDRLSSLPSPHIKALLLNYFNKVVTLREEDRRLRLQCEEQQLQLQEQGGVARELEAALQRLTVATDRRITEQQRQHQQSLQKVLQELREARGEGAEQSVRSSDGRVQELEKELFFYKSTSRQLRRKLRELNPALSIEAPSSRGRGHESTENSLSSSVQVEKTPPVRSTEDAVTANKAMTSEVLSMRTTASRFALLQVDSDSDSESGKAKNSQQSGPRAGKSAAGKTNANNDKKKEKKRRRKEQQQSEANELRSLAFKKLPQKSCIPQTTAVPLSATGDQAVPQEGWQQWKQRDEQLTSEMYEADLEKALMLSKLEYEEHKQVQDSVEPTSPAAKGSKKEKRKNQQGKERQRVTVSLKDFHTEGHVDGLNKKQEKEEPKTISPALHDDRFFNKLEDDVSKIVLREKRREQYSNSSGLEVSTSTEHEPDVRAEQLKYELEKKDLEIERLKTVISQWESKYKEVKARNTVLLKILQQGEMKDKAEILQQVEDLLNIKEELSLQVTLLHASLEQEKSKVKGLQSEQPKHQQGNKRGRKAADGDL
ncbi:hypothetical protein GJAV_G00026660 [Gymnothorax javanicus]|nr:hypothetical protein GJAV_G00026660 [Gymnothorax javanicus]